ncbi:major facilitator superfamily domain-containing protein [Dactylonectria estremocensis]|uniref:Major facilitator superfamily domain-containing protein n=1 Tax=Dactylonectria estremocensis TaxID=1079267 RepID=A0A9P9J3L0_9HYPO|nr:major facilitator superfamily domain-containing protein [Dactylonectria estremocensis]
MARATRSNRNAMASSTSYATANPTMGDTETTRLLGNGAQDGLEGDRTDASDGGWDGYNDFEGMPWWRRPSVYWLLGPFAIFTLAFGGVMVPRLNLILDFVCKEYFADKKLQDPDVDFIPVLLGSDNPQCEIPEVQRNAATFMLVMNLLTGVLSAVVAPRLGRLSDRYGRTRLMALSSVGGVLAEIITVLAVQFPGSIDYRWLLLGSVFDGLTGSFTAGSIMSQSYTSDCTPPSKRAVYMGYMHACLFSGLAFGPIMAGYFAKWTGNLISIFYAVIVFHVFFMLTVGFIVPESLSKQKQLAAREKWGKEQEMRVQVESTSWLASIQSVNPFEPLKILWPKGPGTSPTLRRNLVAMAINDTIILGSSMAAGAVIVLYSRYIFHWGNFEASRFVSALSFVRVVVLLVIFPLINHVGRTLPAARRREAGVIEPDKQNGADHLDVWILRVALTSDVLGSIGYALARSESVFFGSGMLTAFGGLGSATSQAIITKHVPPQRVGQVLGAIGMLHALSRVLGPVLFNGLYAATVKVFPQAIFVLLATTFGIALTASFVVKTHGKLTCPFATALSRC